MRRLDRKRCNLVEKERQSYFVVLHDVLAMTSNHVSKELVGKQIAH